MAHSDYSYAVKRIVIRTSDHLFLLIPLAILTAFHKYISAVLRCHIEKFRIEVKTLYSDRCSVRISGGNAAFMTGFQIIFSSLYRRKLSTT
jgi:hypothetical protein